MKSVQRAWERSTIELTFARHGSTDWNRDRRFQGQVDVPLNAEGRGQADAIARALRDVDFDYAVSSDLSRAYQTARIIRGDRPLERDARWREMDFGQWDGLTWEQIVRRWPQAGAHGRLQPAHYAPFGGETFAALCARVSAALNDLQAHSYERVLVVTHAGPLHAVLQTCFEETTVSFGPASLTSIDLGAEKRIVRLNDISHLSAPKTPSAAADDPH